MDIRKNLPIVPNQDINKPKSRPKGEENKNSLEPDLTLPEPPPTLKEPEFKSVHKTIRTKFVNPFWPPSGSGN